MTVNFSNSMVGLSLLTGNGSIFAAASAGIPYESKAVRIAKAAFTAPETTPPWKLDGPTGSLSSQVSAVQAMKTIIDKTGTGTELLPDDIQTSFTAYKALDRLRVLAETASAKTTSDAQRAKLQQTFAKGLADLQSFLGTAPSSQVNLAFDQAARYAKTVGVPMPSTYEKDGKGVVTGRNDAVPGLTGQEKFTITLGKPGRTSETVTVDLSKGPQPPTVDSLAASFNAAIQAIPATKADGTVQVDQDGNPVPKWKVKFDVEKFAGEKAGSAGKWGLSLKSPLGSETVTLDQVGAKDAIVVATGYTPLDAPTSTSVFRLNDPAGGGTTKTLTKISALDSLETERAKLSGKTTTTTTVTDGPDGKPVTTTTKSSDVYANTNAAAIITDKDGNSYVVGTTAGDLGSNLSDGDDNLFLTKLDGEGKVVWQRSLGAGGSSSGAAISMGADGSLVVAGTVNGQFDGASTDGDMFVGKFDTQGNEQFSTVVRSSGADTAKAVAVGADGSIYVGGRSAKGGGDAFIARIDATGKIAERNTIAGTGSESINGLAIDGDGNVLALMSRGLTAEIHKLDGTNLSNELGSLQLGTADARAIAVNSDGTIAVGGATRGPLSGTQVNAISGGRDGFVARIDAGLSGASVTYLGSSADDQVDSVAFMNGELYVGGRTAGEIGSPRKGAVDGFVSRLDLTTGTVQHTNQFGLGSQRTEAVRIAANTGGDNAVSALGFARGTINPTASAKVTTGTALREGDYFSIRVNNGALRKITITADDTMETIAERIRGIVGSKAKVTTPKLSGQQTLRIDPKEGQSFQLIPGGQDQDALEKLGLSPERIAVPVKVSDDAPKVRPGGSFGLKLSEALTLSTLDDAKLALGTINSALSMTQTAYRSLYWDDAKASMVNGVKNTNRGNSSTAIEQAQLANYQAALSRLSSPAPSMTGF